MTEKILFIGAGNMASSLIGGLVNAGTAPQSLLASDINLSALQVLRNQYGITIIEQATDVIASVDTVVLAVKPQNMREVCLSLAPTLATLSSKTIPLIVSIAAGIRIQAMIKWLGVETAIIRTMPNTPAMVNCGASGMFANPSVSEQQRQIAESILAATGIVVWLDKEAQIDTVTALSGSGPAYFFKIMESLTKSAIELGLSAETARLLSVQTALGAATMASRGDVELEELRRRVTSPGGTTEKGLQALEDNDIDVIMKQVLLAAQQRSVEIADQLGEK